ncbi:hypothetical protein P4H66_06150 [Paenibacillus dokdonensis]|uniref:Uncharacterized protein n=1 Tax=Paenibacillus dokdonensis TaxID=2567944 RepID=A0ABU6GI75_9BACL|nr:hypothetical protein [Paenibacillus dokdonensis]MEC0239436.1 hypothetical protein [Paenibacillus dokdonensis]
MSFLIKKIIKRLVEKTAAVDPSDVMSQINAEDLLHLVKDMIL